MRSVITKIYRSPKFYRYRQWWFLTAVGFLFVLLRLPSLIEPHWYGDEGIYQVVGMAINDGRVLYKEIWDNKPPLLYIIYAVANSNLFAVKAISLLAGLFSVVAFYFLAKKLLHNLFAVFFSTFIFACLFGLPILEGNIANAENFMLLPVVLSAYLLVIYIDNKKTGFLVLSGLLLSVALIIKIVAVFDFAAFFIFFLLAVKRVKFPVKESMIYILSFVSLILICSVYFLLNGALQEFMSGVFLQNVSYVGNQYGSASPEMIFTIKAVLLAGIVFLLFLKRKTIGNANFFIFLWCAFAVYSSLFSARPYTHYLLVVLPPFALMMGVLFTKTRMRLSAIISIILICLLSYYHFGIYRKNFTYYKNYVSFITGSKSLTSYETFFDGNTPRDYNIARFISQNTTEEDAVFLWSDSAQIYALSRKLPIGKYIVAYHITTYEDAHSVTRKRIDEIKPKFIIQTSKEILLKELLYSYRLRYIMEGTMIYEREI